MSTPRLILLCVTLALAGCALNNALSEPPRDAGADASTSDIDFLNNVATDVDDVDDGDDGGADVSPDVDPGPCGGLDLPGFSCVSGGSFTQGSPPEETGRDADEVAHTVRISRDFLIAQTETTQSEWAEFYPMPAGNTPGCPECPVERVTWFEALHYANARSFAEDLQPCYNLEECRGSIGEGCTSEVCEGFYACGRVSIRGPECTGYRLPTEAEWEYAARAGSSAARYGAVDDVAWVRDNASFVVHAVGQKVPNELGLYDPLGNLLEWTLDGYEAYPSEPVTDPVGGVNASMRVTRGGSFWQERRRARAAWRGAVDADIRSWEVGFRLVRTAP